MGSYTIRRRDSDEEMAELATAALVQVAIAAFVVVGAVVVGVVQEISTTYREQGGMANPTLRRAGKILAIGWVAAIAVSFVAPGVGGLIGLIVTVVFVGMVYGARPTPQTLDRAGEIDTYLDPFPGGSAEADEPAQSGKVIQLHEAASRVRQGHR